MVHPAPDAAPAGFLARYAAWSLDAACLLPLVALLAHSPVQRAVVQAQAAWQTVSAVTARLLGEALAGAPSPTALAHALLADPALRAASLRLQAAIAVLLLAPLLLYAACACLWSLGFECSSWQATPGKRALGLTVVDADGRRLRPGRAFGRFLAAGLSWLSGNIGHAMAAVPPHLALHDRLSGTRVLAARAGLPAWARAWLAVQALALCIAIAWLFTAMQSAMEAALLRAAGG